MHQLREKNLLWKAFKFVVLPFTLMACLGSYFPFMQAIVPVHESDACICLFLYEKNTTTPFYPIFSHISDNEKAFDALVGINSTSFYAVNWFFLLINI